jgi:thiol peroxidase
MATIYFHGQPVQTNAQLPAVGLPAPDFVLTNEKLRDITLADFAGSKKLLLIVPSLDAPVCAASARKLNAKCKLLPNTVILVISADLPFAQCRFCQTERLNQLIPLSTFRSNFAFEYGVKILDHRLAGLTARAIVIIDEMNQVIYSQLVAELTEEPDYESIFNAIKSPESAVLPEYKTL